MTYQPVKNIPCVICGNPSIARKLCKPCYYKMRWKNNLNNFPLLIPQDVFLDRILKTESCWIWQGTKNDYGYGIFILPGDKKIRAHRYSYEIHKGTIPDGMVVMHTCDNPPCVNPEHLKLGTKLDNNRDAHKKGRRPNGEKSHFAKLTVSQVIENNLKLLKIIMSDKTIFQE